MMSGIGKGDGAYSGSIPKIYDTYLGPLLFEPYAAEVALRACQLGPSRILETAAGSGIVTARLADALPVARIVATDLNQAMLDVAADRIDSEKVAFMVADAQDLPFDDESFDLVVCQFGVMFFPDRVKGASEARRVLRDGGTYLMLVWDRIENNKVSHRVQQEIARLMPDDTPLFLERAPYGYHDIAAIEADLRAGGFGNVRIETVDKQGRLLSAAAAAEGLINGTPLRAEIQERDPAALDKIVAAVTDALGDGSGLDLALRAHIVTAHR